MSNNPKGSKRSYGFTLIELLIVTTIIAILLAIGFVTYSHAQKSTRIAKRVDDLNRLPVALELYKNSNGYYPKHTVVDCITNNLTELVPDFINTLPKDPLQKDDGTNCYKYQSDAEGAEYKIWSTVDSSEMVPAVFMGPNASAWVLPGAPGSTPPPATPPPATPPPATPPQSSANFQAYSLYSDSSFLYVSMSNNSGFKLFRTPDGVNWSQVGTVGLGDMDNIKGTAMTGFNGYLYLATHNNIDGTQIFRSLSTDGQNWTKVNTDGFGDTNSKWIRVLDVFNSTLYAGVSNSPSGGKLYKTNDGTSWTAVSTNGLGDTNNSQIYGSAVFNNKFYLSTHNGTGGSKVYESSDGANWSMVNSAGFGKGSQNYGSKLSVLSGNLYAATANLILGTEVYKYAGGTSWTQVNSSGFNGSSSNFESYAFYTLNGNLYAGVSNNNNTGTKVWRSSDGSIWTQFGTNGLGTVNNTFITGISGFLGYLFIGTNNVVDGGQIQSFLP